MSKVKEKKTIKEYDEDGNLVKETIIEKETEEENNYMPYTPTNPPWENPFEWDKVTVDNIDIPDDTIRLF